jgi:hypothetical protein
MGGNLKAYLAGTDMVAVSFRRVALPRMSAGSVYRSLLLSLNIHCFKYKQTMISQMISNSIFPSPMIAMAVPCPTPISTLLLSYMMKLSLTGTINSLPFPSGAGVLPYRRRNGMGGKLPHFNLIPCFLMYLSRKEMISCDVRFL